MNIILIYPVFVFYFPLPFSVEGQQSRQGRVGRLNKKGAIPKKKGNYKEVLVFLAPDQDLLKWIKKGAYLLVEGIFKCTYNFTFNFVPGDRCHS